MGRAGEDVGDEIRRTTFGSFPCFLGGDGELSVSDAGDDCGREDFCSFLCFLGVDAELRLGDVDFDDFDEFVDDLVAADVTDLAGDALDNGDPASDDLSDLRGLTEGEEIP